MTSSTANFPSQVFCTYTYLCAKVLAHTRPKLAPGVSSKHTHTHTHAQTRTHARTHTRTSQFVQVVHTPMLKSAPQTTDAQLSEGILARTFRHERARFARDDIIAVFLESAAVSALHVFSYMCIPPKERSARASFEIGAQLVSTTRTNTTNIPKHMCKHRIRRVYPFYCVKSAYEINIK